LIGRRYSGPIASVRELLRGNVLILMMGTVIRQLTLFITFPSIIGLMAGGYVFDAGPSLPWVILGSMTLVNAVIMAFLIKPGEAS